MGREEDEDLLRTAEVSALPVDGAEHATVPVDFAAVTRPPPARIAVKPRRISDPVTGRTSIAPIDEGWMSDETSLTRATEKTLSAPAAVISDRATLTVLTGLHAGQIFALDAHEHVIGRGTEADLWLEDSTISRRHATIGRRPDGHFELEDCGSTNGTFVAGRRVEARAELQNGDRIQLGPVLMLRFGITDDAEEALQRRLYESSTRDALTRAFNRKYLNERLLAEVAHARRHRTQLSVVMFDLDRFKEVNDVHGHLAGDLVLRVVSSHVARLIRVEDVFARYGGEEFMIVARSTALKDARTLGERVRSTIERLRVDLPGKGTLAVTSSVGVAALTELAPEAGMHELIASADARLYRAKMGGRNRVCGEG